MANKYWVGADGTSCSFSTAASWAATIGGAPGAGLAAGDDAFILDSTSIIDTGLSNGALSIASLTVRGGSPAIGTSGTSLTLLAVTGNITYAPTSGRMYINPGTLSGMLSAPGQGGAILTISGGTFNGDISLGLAGSCGILAATFGGSGRLLTAGYAVTVSAGVTVPVFSVGPSATVTCSGTVTSLIVAASGYFQAIGACVVTSGIVWGTIRCNATGTITLLDVRAGGRSTTQGGVYPFTITNSRREANTYFFDDDSLRPTLSNATVLAGY